MFWILLVLILSAAITIGGFIDNYAADVVFKKNRPEAFQALSSIVYAVLLVLIVIFAGLQSLAWWHIAVFVLAGILDGLGNIPYFKALKFEETTSITILRQATPIFALILGVLFLNQTINWVQLVAFLFILGAAAVVLFSTNKRRAKFESRTVLFMLIAILTWVVSEVIFVAAFTRAHDTHIVETSGIWTVLFWFALGKGGMSALLGFTISSWRARIKRVWRDNPQKLTLSVLGAHTIRVSADCLWRFIITIAPLALANVITNVTRLLFTFGFGLAFSLVWPTFGREKVTKRAVFYHLIGVVLAVIGVILLQINVFDV
jgi:drug/metabolite transporter (DMT)-like permease